MEKWATGGREEIIKKGKEEKGRKLITEVEEPKRETFTCSERIWTEGMKV